MAIWCFNKAIVCGSVLSAALIYCIVMLHNRREKKESNKTDNSEAFEIKVIGTSTPNIHSEKQSFDKNSTNANDTPLRSKIRQVASPLSNKNTPNNPVKPPRSKILYQIQSKAVAYCNSIMQNSARFFTHNKSSETIILNNSASSFEHGLGNVHDNLNHSVVIRINDSIDSINNKIQMKVPNRPVKLSTLNMKTLHASDDSSTKNRSAGLIMITQKAESKEIDIVIPSFNRQPFVEHLMTFRGNRLTNPRNNKCTKETEKNNITITINGSM